jgi:hypothetical protein
MGGACGMGDRGKNDPNNVCTCEKMNNNTKFLKISQYFSFVRKKIIEALKKKSPKYGVSCLRKNIH